MLLLIGGVQAQQIDSIAVDSAQTQVEDTRVMKSLFAGEPGRAFLYSLILPGAGQIYNKSYWKLPIVYAALGTTGYILYDNIQTYNDYDDAYKLRVDMGDAADTIFPTLSRSQVQGNREIVRKNVQRSYIALSLVYFIGAAEAFVDRHLQSFDISDDLSIKFDLEATPVSLGVLCSFEYKPPPTPRNLILH